MKYVCLVCIFISGCLFSQASERQKKIDWSSPKTIDPLNKHIDDFLNVNINRYIAKAQDYYKKEEFKKAAQVYLFLLRYRFDDPVILYNLSCCYGKMGESELASRFLMFAVDSGFREKQVILNDHDFDPIRKDSLFKKTEQRIHTHLDKLGLTEYCNAPSYIPFRYRLPQRAGAETPQALVVAFHGNGGNNDRFILLADDFLDNDIAFAAPRGMYPFQAQVRNSRSYSWFLKTADRSFWKKADPLTVEYAFNVISEMKKKSYTDQAFVMGFSQGAAVACLTGVEYPGSVRGIISISGVCPEPFLEKAKLTKISGLRVFIAHGKQDSIVSVNEAYKTKAMFEKYGCQVTFFLYDGGHTLTDSLLKTVSNWILQQSANPEI